MVKELGEGGVVRRVGWLRSSEGTGTVERSGWLGGWGGQGAHRGEKVEKRGRQRCEVGTSVS